jgi:hypothetical protein
MEGIAPTLLLCSEMRLGMECGQSALTTAKRISMSLPIDIRTDFLKIIYEYDKNGSVQIEKYRGLSRHRIALFALITLAFVGEPILPRLKELESEIKSECEEELDKYVVKMSFQAMIPLLLLQLPAFLLLLFGPILNSFTKGLL